MDRIELRGLRCRGVVLDLSLETDVSACARTDDFRAAVDYWDVEKTVRAVVDGRPWRLPGEPAERSAALVLARYPRVLAATATARKKNASARVMLVRGGPSGRVASLSVEGISCSVHVGVPEQERRERQRVLVDLVLEADPRATDPQTAAAVARAAAQARPRMLLETLAEDVARAVLRRERSAAAVLVRAHKKPRVMPRTGDVVVEIRRRREGRR